MALQFYIGSSGAGKSETLYRDIINQSLTEPETDIFVLVPDQFTMQTQKKLVTMHPNRGIMKIDVLSFSRLTYRIFEETGQGKAPVLDDTGKSLLLRKIAHECAESLQAIGSNMKRLGYIHEVKSVISEFMQYGIGRKELESLTEYAKGRGSLYYKLRDLQILYGAFQDRIEGSFVTTEGLLGLLAEALDKSERIRNSIIAFDGFTGFTPVQYQVIRKMMTLAKEVKMTILMDAEEAEKTDDGEQKLFHLSKKTIGKMTALAEETGTERKPDILLREKPVRRFVKNPSMAHLEKELFRYRNRRYEKEQDSIHILEASNPWEEVRQTCVCIRKLIREKGYKYRDFGVICSDLSAYVSYVEEEFERFGIPCYVDATKGIALNPFIEYIRSALQVLLYDFSYESVFHFLRSGFTGIAWEEIDRLENYVLKTGIRGKKKWSEMFVRRNTQDLETLNRVREQVMELLRPLMGKGTQVKDYVNRIYDFLMESRAYEKLAVLEEEWKQAGELAKAKEYGQIYKLTMELLEQIYDLCREETMTLQEFADILDSGFGEIQVGTIPQNADRVVAGDMERTRLKEIKVLFFLGVNDGNIPKSVNRGGIISDIDREFLSEGKWEMSPAPRQQMYIQRLYLYMNMTKPEHMLFLSYARVSSEGKAMRPAYLISVVEKMFPGLSRESFVAKSMQEDVLSELARIEEPEDGFFLLAEEMRKFAASGLKERERFFFTLYRAYAEREDYALRLERLKESAFFRYEKIPLGREVAKALYGDMLVNSISRLEQYASCAYSYFLEYGLSLKERETFGFEAADMGTVFHSVLERFGYLLDERGLDWFSFSKEQGEALLEKAVESCTAMYGDSILFSSAKYRYAIKRMERILKRTVFTLQSQLRKGKFRPEYFEVSFQSLSDVQSVTVSLSEEEKIRLQGRIDRIDTCREEDTVYVKVIDYKSGNRSLDIAAVYYGLQLQLVVYTNAAVEMLQKKEKGKEVVPAAMLYYHINDPMIQADGGEMTPEALDEKIRENLRMTGLVNGREDIVSRLDGTFLEKSEVIPVERKKDGSFGSRSSLISQEEFQTVSSYVNYKIKRLAQDMLDGGIGKEPYAYGQRTACEYCAYKGVCGFKEGRDGYGMRNLEPLDKAEALQKMREQGE